MQTKKPTESQNLLLSEVPHWPFLIAIPVLIILVSGIFWNKQQENIEPFSQQLPELKKRINAFPNTSIPKKQIEKQLEALQNQINTLPLATQQDQKSQQIRSRIKQQLLDLKQEVNILPSTSDRDQLALSKDYLLLEKEEVNLKNAIYISLIQVLGTLLFLITAYLTWRNVRTAEKALKTTQDKQEADNLNAKANLRATEEKQVTERFSKAIELLGHIDQQVRIGGIYALERIAKDSQKDHWTIVEVLSSYVRSKSPLQEQMGSQARNLENSVTNLPEAASLSNQTSIELDVQAALTVIGRRNTTLDPLHENQTINLRNCNFYGFSLRDANFNFSRANLNNTFWGFINLKKANFEKALLCETQFRQTDLTEAIFQGASLTKANLDFATLIDANFTKAECAGAQFHHADLKKANLSNANLFQSNLASADLSEANLSGADLTDAILTGTKLSGANLSGADLTRVVGLSREQFDQAITDEHTKPPEEWQQPETGQLSS